MSTKTGTEEWENKMEPKILFEDENILAINKPAGLVVHSDGKTKEINLVDWLIQKFPKIKDVGEPWVKDSGEEILRSGIVHRLDRETSGVMLVAKTQEGFECLKEQFQKHKIEKIYHALVYGEMKNDFGVIDRAIGRSSKDFRLWSAQRGARGQMREAITEYKVLSKKGGYSLVEVSPKTGRTHQIRVHFKAINYPLVSDSLYAPNHPKGLGLDRLGLHSYKVGFSDLKGEKHEVIAEYPPDFEKVVDLLQSL